jgi:outer membrane protein OmpA-like peptidoglycan-associated protein
MDRQTIDHGVDRRHFLTNTSKSYSLFAAPELREKRLCNRISLDFFGYCVQILNHSYMKKPLNLVLIALFVSVSTTLCAQNDTELAPGYYVVVGAYAQSRVNIAQNYVETLTRRGLDAHYGYNSSRRLYFVYLRYFDNLKESLNDMYTTRKQAEFSDSWVRVVPGDITAKGTEQPKDRTAAAKPKETPATQTSQPVATAPAQTQPQTQTTPTPAAETPVNPADSIAVSDNPPIKQYNPVTLGNTEVFLSLFHGRNNRIVDGEVKVIDTDRAKLLKNVKGNEYLMIPDPKSQSGKVTLIAEVFGYRKIQQEINYPLPLQDTVKPEIDYLGTTFVINFDMVRYHAGDIATLYNVYFYNDAAIMDPRSKYELNSLLQMMQENPKYKITLHGHTNGNYHGKIFVLGDTKDFFSLKGAKETVGSAKELSGQRAEVIRQYLIANGIGEDRIKVEAWGGRRPLYDKHSPNARQNVRVEVEINEE